MGKAVKSVGRMFGIGGGGSSGAGAYVNPAMWNIQAEAKPFQQQQQELLKQSMDMARAGAPAGAEVLAQMGQAALGQGPSLAEVQMKAAQDRTLAQQLAAARSGRAGGASAARGLMRAQGEAGRNIAQGAAEARLQERANFQNALAQAQQGARQDIGAGFELAVAPKREQQQAEAMRANVDMARTQARRQQQSAILGQILGGASMGFAKSDKNSKKEIKKEDNKYSDFLDKLQAYSYDYKDSNSLGASPGRKHGIMAQDLEKSEVGRSMVKEIDGNKMVDIASGFGAVLASQAELNKRLKKVEKKGKA